MKIITSIFFLLSTCLRASNVIPEIYITKEELLNNAQGSVIGGAIGDAMGKVTEFLSAEEIKKQYSNGINSFEDFHTEDFWDVHGSRIAPYTDDTQLAKIIFEEMIEARRNHLHVNVIMENVANQFIKWVNDPDGGLSQERAPGQACIRGAKELERRIKYGKEKWGPQWWACGGGKNSSYSIEGGSGSVMRAGPVGIVFADQPKVAEQLAVAQSLLTHRAPIARAASAAMAVGVAYAIRKIEPLIVAQKMIDVATKYDKGTGNLIRWAVERANDSSSPKAVLDILQGWAAHEAIAGATYIFLTSPDIKKAIHLGVHTPGDSDTLASMGAALVGARLGITSIPEKWVQTIEGSSELCKLCKEMETIFSEENET